MPQLIPVGALLTVPVPVPALVTVKVCVVATLSKVAVTLFAALILSVQVVAVPVQAPDQLVNLEPEAGVAVKVTLVLVV